MSVVALALDRPLGFRPLQSASLVLTDGTEWRLPVVSGPGSEDTLELGWIRRDGAEAPCELVAAGEVGVRGPYGNGIDPSELAARRVFLIGEGGGIAALRPLVRACLAGGLSQPVAATALFGGRRQRDLPFREEMQASAGTAGLSVRWAVERPETGWDGAVGVLPVLFRGMPRETPGSLAISAGPSPLHKFVALELLMRGVPGTAILVVPETGPGCRTEPCSACASGAVYACERGPVFSWQEFREAGGAR